MDQATILNDTPNNLIKKYYQVLINNHILVDKILLFGSYAKNIAKPWSDLDLCIVSPQFGHDPFQERVMLKKLTLNIDTMIEPVPYHPNDLNNRYDPLAFEISQHGIPIPL